MPLATWLQISSVRLKNQLRSPKPSFSSYTSLSTALLPVFCALRERAGFLSLKKCLRQLHWRMWDPELLEENKSIKKIKSMKIFIFTWRRLHFLFHMTLTGEKWYTVLSSKTIFPLWDKNIFTEFKCLKDFFLEYVHIDEMFLLYVCIIRQGILLAQERKTEDRKKLLLQMLHWSLKVLLLLQLSTSRAKCRVCFSHPSKLQIKFILCTWQYWLLQKSVHASCWIYLECTFLCSRLTCNVCFSTFLFMQLSIQAQVEPMKRFKKIFASTCFPPML